MHRLSMYRTATAMSVVILLLCLFCLAYGEPGSSSFYLTLFSLIVIVPFLAFLLVQLVRDRRRMKRERELPAAAQEERPRESQSENIPGEGK